MAGGGVKAPPTFLSKRLFQQQKNFATMIAFSIPWLYILPVYRYPSPFQNVSTAPLRKEWSACHHLGRYPVCFHLLYRIIIPTAADIIGDPAFEKRRSIQRSLTPRHALKKRRRSLGCWAISMHITAVSRPLQTIKGHCSASEARIFFL